MPAAVLGAASKTGFIDMQHIHPEQCREYRGISA
jgi:hypothetical protein